MSFCLKAEMLHLTDAWHRQVAHVIVFHEARITEVLCRQLCENALGRAAPNLYSNVESLRSAEVLSPALALQIHGVRRLGNEARHATRSMGTLDAALATLWTRSLLFTIGSASSGRDTVWSEHQISAASAGHQEQVSLLVQAGAVDLTPGPEHLETALQAVEGQPAAELAILEWALDRCIPARIANCAERLSNRHEAIARFPQIHAVALSRLDQLDTAERILRESLMRESGAEAMGILGGILKRRWLRDSGTERLVAATAAYQVAWSASAGLDSYPGINLAALLHWQGRFDEASLVASQVLTRINANQDRSCGSAQSANGGYWQTLTEIEALALCGRWDDADRLRASLDQIPEFPRQAIDVADSQLQRHRGVAHPNGHPQNTP